MCSRKFDVRLFEVSRWRVAASQSQDENVGGGFQLIVALCPYCFPKFTLSPVGGNGGWGGSGNSEVEIF